MKTHRFIVDNRRESILRELTENPELTVNDLAELFEISTITIRRDLQVLEDNNKVTRHYGGAKVVYVEEEKDENLLCREAIAMRAAELIEDGDSIFINTSSTALKIVKYIKDKKVTVITNNGKALYIDRDPCVTIVLTGGEVRDIKDAMVGEFALNNLNRVSAKKSFLGCSGLSVETGMTTEIMHEVNVNELMVSRVTGKCYILASHEKLGVNSSFVSCPVSNISNIITDYKASDEMVGAFEAMDINVIKASPKEDKHLD